MIPSQAKKTAQARTSAQPPPLRNHDNNLLTINFFSPKRDGFYLPLVSLFIPRVEPPAFVAPPPVIVPLVGEEDGSKNRRYDSVENHAVGLHGEQAHRVVLLLFIVN